MNLLCTSFPFAPRRIARSRAARWLVAALAIVLALSNVAVAAMPDASVDHHDVATAGLGSSHAHCAGHVDPTPGHAGHGIDCSCCGKACVCAQACDVLAAVAMKTSIACSRPIFHRSNPRAYAAIERRLLRPPIG